MLRPDPETVRFGGERAFASQLALDPDFTRAAAQIALPEAAQVRRAILARSARLTAAMAPEAVEAAQAAAARLGVEGEVELYQRDGEENAGIHGVREAVMVEVHGRMLTLLDRPSSLALYGHELGHRLAHGPDSELGRAGVLARHLLDRLADGALRTTASRLAMAQEITADRFAVLAAEDELAFVRLSLALTTGLPVAAMGWDVGAYLEQCQAMVEAIRKGETAIAGTTHPEHSIRAWAAWRFSQTDRHRELTGRGEGSVPLATLDEELLALFGRDGATARFEDASLAGLETLHDASLACVALVANADGVVDERESDAIERVFGSLVPDWRWYLVWDNALQRFRELTPLLAAAGVDAMRALVGLLTHVTAADGKLEQSEVDMIVAIGDCLGRGTLFRSLLPPVLRSLGEPDISLEGGKVVLPLSARAGDVDAALAAWFGGMARRGGGRVALPRLLRLAGLTAWDDGVRGRIARALADAELAAVGELAALPADGVLEVALTDAAHARREARVVTAAPATVALPPDTTEREHLRNALTRLRDKLVSGDGRSPSVRMYGCRPGRSFDLAELDRVSVGHGERTLALLQGGQRARLVEAAEAGSHEGAAAVAEALRLLDREQRARLEETGADDLALGWPFVAGVIDGYLFRAPLILTPVKFEVDNRGARSFALRRTDDPPSANHALLRLLFRRKDFSLPDDVIEKLDAAAAEGPEGIVRAVEGLGLPLRSRPAEMRPLADRTEEFRDWTGSFFEVEECAVVGLFPQSGSDILQDYDRMLTELGDPARRPADVLACALEVLPANLREALRGAVAAEPPVEHPVVPITSSDPSQLEVIHTSRAHRALVVDGPPGTGKSQTIVNLVADALARGQSVAVVCEKRAAIDVVAQRLDGLGLGHLLALVHDVQHDRRALYQRVLHRLATPPAPDAGRPIEELRAEKAAIEAELAARAEVRHAMRPGPGVSLDALHAEAACLPGAPLPGGDALTALALHARDAFVRHLTDLHPYADLAAASSPWSGLPSGGRVWIDDLDVDGRAAFSRALDGAAGTAEAFAAAAHAAGPDALPALLDRVRRGLAAARAARELRADDAGRRRLGQLLRRAEAAADVLDQAEQAAAGWGADREAALAVRAPLELQPAPALERALPVVAGWSGNLFRFLSLGWWSARSAVRGWLGVHWPDGLAADTDARLAGAIRQRLAASRAWGVARTLAEALGALVPGDAPAADAWVGWVAAAVPRVRDLLDHRTALKAAGAWPTEGDAEAWEAHDARVDALSGALAALDVHRAALAPVRARLPAVADTTPAAALREQRRAWDRDGARLVEHDRRLRLATHAVPSAPQLLAALVAAHAGGPPGRWVDTVRRTWAEAWLTRLEAEDPRVRALDGPTAFGTEAAAGARLGALVRDLAERERGRIRHLADQGELLTTAPAEYRRRRTELQAAREQLLKDASRQRYVLPLRTFVRQYADKGLLQVLPVWLVSPETMAVLFEGRPQFDLAIMDEASQCTVEAGLPVLTRARRVVIAGDDKQMPPTSFFEGSAALEEGDDTPVAVGGDGLEAESLLVLARDRVSRTPLRWHYRCHDEELIAFSNHAMYRGDLLTFPSTATPRSRPALRWVEVPDGAYDGGANPAEARRVVDLVDELLRDEPGRSLGVVSFNLQQRKAILDAIDARRASDPGFAERWEGAANDPRIDNRPFVKNLEAVQGDERDVIVFSLGHAPIPRRGRPGGPTELYVPARFGPLGLAGGERRLNVAVSRARRLCCVVCSFTPEQLSIAGAKNDGPKLLKAWLEYAWALHRGERVAAARILDRVREDGPVRRQAPAGGRDVVPVQVQLGEALRRHGLACEVDLGSSGFRIPLAVAEAADAPRFRVAVLVDQAGERPEASRVLVPSVLEGRGWTVVRVDARRWHREPAEVEAEVLAAVERSRQLEEERRAEAERRAAEAAARRAAAAAEEAARRAAEAAEMARLAAEPPNKSPVPEDDQ